MSNTSSEKGEHLEDFEPGGATQIPLDRLRAVTELPLSPNAITALSAAWGGENAVRAWSDIEWVAQQFMNRASSHQVDATITWHHLVVAVGNFKRSTGRNYPANLPLPSPGFQAQDKFTIPAHSLDVYAGATESWRHLTDAVYGFDVPTATALLSAVWPGQHVIIDRRDTVAAVGLTTTQWNSEGYEDAKLPPRKPYSAYWDLYEWLLPLIRAAAIGVAPVNVERALYVLDIKVRKNLPPKGNWKWRQYAELASGLVAACDAPTSTGTDVI